MLRSQVAEPCPKTKDLSVTFMPISACICAQNWHVTFSPPLLLYYYCCRPVFFVYIKINEQIALHSNVQSYEIIYVSMSYTSNYWKAGAKVRV